MIAAYVKVNAVLTNLNLADNQLCGVGKYGGGTYDATGITALAEGLKVNAVLTKLECVSRPKRMPETPETKPETLARNKHGRFLARRSASTGCSRVANGAPQLPVLRAVQAPKGAPSASLCECSYCGKSADGHGEHDGRNFWAWIMSFPNLDKGVWIVII